MRSHDVCEPGQIGISCRVAVPIVDVLEAVDVSDQKPAGLGTGRHALG